MPKLERGTRSRVVPLTNLPSPLEFHMVPPSPMEQVYSPGWPTPVPTSVQEDLGIADPRCSNTSCRAFQEGFADDERRTPLLEQLEYGKWTVWFYSFWILVFAAIYVSRLLHDRLRRLKKIPGRRPSLKEKTIAVTRFCAYRRLNNHVTRSIGLCQISYGTLVLLSFSTVFFAILPWPQQRYLQAYSRFGAPPLSVRCALIMSALTPLTVALAGKVNVITWITGVSYTKLNVYHRYISYVIFCLGTVHTVPHLMAPIRDGGWSMLNKLYANEQRVLSGTALYFTTFGLAFFSIPWIRRRFYEAFKCVHIFLGISYIGLLWWHVWGEYMSPYYVYATIAVLFSSNIIRIVYRHQNLRSFSNLNGFPTTLTHLHGNTTRVAIEVPKSLKWKPGQHAFLKMPIISTLGSHPFFIANIPSSEKEGITYEVVFLVQRHKGFTKKLFEYEKGVGGDVDLRIPVYNMDQEKLKATKGKARAVEFETEKPVLKKESPEHIEDINDIVFIDTITVLEHKVISPMSYASSSSTPLPIIPSTFPTLKHQSSTSSFPARDEITEATLQAIAQKPAGIRTTPNSSTQAIPPASFRTTPLASFRTGSSTNRRSSIYSLPPVDDITEAALLSIAAKRGHQPALRTIVDGPYGTHHRPLHQIYDTVLSIAGGSGIAASLPHILDLTQRLRHQKKDDILVTRRIHLVWIIRDVESLPWIERELSTAIRNVRDHPTPNNCSFTVDVFVTRSAALAESASLSEDELGPLSPISPPDQRVSDRRFDSLGDAEKGVSMPAKPRPALRRLNGGRGLFDHEAAFGIERGEGSAGQGVSVAMHYCRPVIKDLIEGYVGGDRAIVMGCGPPSLSAEIANTTASLQRRVWNSEMREVKLEIETFGW
ncbi:hypothetical protein K505DRAFT_333378 [Melanomma pulvis-pyrius CBS 109.77]|uniref:ferric-chelate reductase (NADPH) n=1 Tax=Melanomma pulvis-pyrius CBS 109.77 TaxID=1314802 RepID=A0A6A6XPR5_9PLEO|nr:hypothetical protein K505DRAFT_333378 [Melanomma pulvis-pyrius CBS 109.77]